MIIDTEIRPVVVEIDDQEYSVAAKTVEVLDKLRHAEDASIKAGKMPHEMQLAQLEILLGKSAMRQLFASGKQENADRISAIYYGVLEAFDYNSRQTREARSDAVADEFKALADAIQPLAQLMSAVRNVPDGKYPTIKRTQT